MELFSQDGANAELKPRAPKALMSYISKYEKTVLIIIGFLITGFISFSLGVKKGKSYIMLKTDSKLDVASRPAPASSAFTGQRKKAVNEPQQYRPVKSKDVTESIQNYTIQVASFSNKVNAQKEAASLKKKGFSPQVLSKGKFSIVCVGIFTRREEAETLSVKLRKQYQDCRIRRL